eukprot:gene12601-8639_t
MLPLWRYHALPIYIYIAVYGCCVCDKTHLPPALPTGTVLLNQSKLSVAHHFLFCLLGASNVYSNFLGIFFFIPYYSIVLIIIYLDGRRHSGFEVSRDVSSNGSVSGGTRVPEEDAGEWRKPSMVEDGSTGCIPEAAIVPASGLAELDQLPSVAPGSSEEGQLLGKTVVLKLNGGLGTGMGLDNAKSLLVVKNGQTFLDFILQHVEAVKQRIRQQASQAHQQQEPLRFMLMNSFSTTKGTTAFLQERYKDVAAKMATEVELMQNQVPKILRANLLPAEWPADPTCEWVPPGHGDLYAALYGSGKLDALLKEGLEYMFVSNSDNLGATLDTRILKLMAEKQVPFLMEVCRRTEGDKKGGHLAIAKETNPALKVEAGCLLLRESAQCPPEETASFQDIEKHSFFNTNNLWIHLPALKALMDRHQGVLPLPVIRNAKTVDPTNPKSPEVYQLETAMGAAIAQFHGATALVVPRDRFTPVKVCGDLLALRSDAYCTTPDHRLILHPDCHGKPPVVSLSDRYKLLRGFESLVAKGVPSMLHCTRLTVKGEGPVVFGGSDIILKGEVCIENNDKDTVLEIPAGTVLENTTYTGMKKENKPVPPLPLFLFLFLFLSLSQSLYNDNMLRIGGDFGATVWLVVGDWFRKQCGVLMCALWHR